MMKRDGLLARGSRFSRPSPWMDVDTWARENRVYPPSSGHPGPRDPDLTPYVIPVMRAVTSQRWRQVVMVCGSQMGKTDAQLDLIGHRMCMAPAPIMYVGPNRQFLSERFEPRLMLLLDEAKTLADRVARGKRATKTRKVISYKFKIGQRVSYRFSGYAPNPVRCDRFAFREER
jgi:phage terminase large subunit GpA-like protein